MAMRRRLRYLNLNKKMTRAGCLGTLLLAGCASVNPVADYQHTTELIHQQTGIEQTYVPDSDPESIRHVVAQMLNDGLTVDEAVRVAMLNNPELQTIFHEVGLSRAQVVAAGLLTNPSLSASVRFPQGGGLSNITAVVSQNIADLLLIPIRRKIAESKLKQMQLRVTQQAVDLIASVKRTAYRLIALQRAEQIMRENLVLAEHSVKLAQRRFDAGEADRLDVNLARSDVLDVQRQLLAVQRDHVMTQAELAHRLGLSRWTQPWQITDEMLKPFELVETPKLIEWAMAQRLDLRIAKLRIESAGQEIEREKAGIISDLSVGVEHERAESPPNLTGPTVNWTLPLWHQNQPQIARAEITLSIYEHQLEALQDATAAQVAMAAAAVRANAQIVQFYDQQSLPQSRQNVEAATRAYETGLHDILRLTQAQRSLIDQRSEYVQALSDYAESLSGLEQAMGGRLNIN